MLHGHHMHRIGLDFGPAVGSIFWLVRANSILRKKIPRPEPGAEQEVAEGLQAQIGKKVRNRYCRT
jgi:hypothetical protein